MKRRFEGVILQDRPRIYFAKIPGGWLLKNTTPSWRIKKPKTGFQRMVPERRARDIAAAVLDQGRIFPNAIVLATDSSEVTHSDCQVRFSRKVRLLIVDGQHRLWAQHFSDYEASYACMVHVGLTLPEMAELFVEINDTQKRVPSSLRWDLVRLVRPQEDPIAVRASDIMERLNSDQDSPLYQRIDMTGEQPEILIKQGSLAPEIRILLNKKTVLKEEGFEGQLEVLKKFLAALRERDPDGWRTAKSNLYGNRVFRALLKLLPEMLGRIEKAADKIAAADFLLFVKRIKLTELAEENVRHVQGNAGIAAFARTIRSHMFPA